MLLKDIDWQVAPGEHWAILGLNGSGKTTLLQLLYGNFWPTTGSLTVLGNKFGQTSIPDLRLRIGWVSQNLQTQIRPFETAEFITLSGKYASIGIYQDYDETAIEEARDTLRSIKADSLIGKPFQILSQGEKQLVLIARALMAKPEILILDEPCNGLDLFARERLLNQISSIAEQDSAPTLLFVTHHTEEIPVNFKHLLLLKHGEIFKQGTRADLFQENILSDFYEKPVQFFKLDENRLAVYPKD
jgi:iron complex transport system ATP-binding protein